MQNTKKNVKARIESNFAKTRKSMGLTQEELAVQISETRQRISAWENGKESPWMRSLFRIADKLKVPHIALIEPPLNYVHKAPSNVKTITTNLNGQYDIFRVYIQFRWEEDKLYMSDHVDGVIELDNNPHANEILDLPVYAYQIMDEVEYADIRRMLKEMEATAQAIRSEQQTPLTNELLSRINPWIFPNTNRDIAREDLLVLYKEEVADYYDRFCAAVRSVMDNAPEYEYLNFCGP